MPVRLVLIGIMLVISACAEPISDAPVPFDIADSPTTSLVRPVEVAFQCGRSTSAKTPAKSLSFLPSEVTWFR